MNRFRILLVDDHPLMRGALRAVLAGQDDMEVVAEAADGHEALTQALRHTPQVVLLDMLMPGMPGTEAAQRLKREVPGVRILALSASEDEAAARQMLSAGAEGYATKSTPTDELLRAIRQVATGARYLDATLARRLEALEGPDGAASSSALTHDEAEVLKLFAQGYPTKQISSARGLGVAVVERHRIRGMQKLGLRTRADVARLAAQQGWLGSHPSG